MNTSLMLKFASAPNICLCIALSPNVGYAGLATCCAAVWIIQPLPSIALTHPKQAGEDPETLPACNGVTLKSLDWIWMG